MGTVLSVCTSEKKGVAKSSVPQIQLLIGHGIVGDAHAGQWHRQVSLLAKESILKMPESFHQVPPGAFAENILTEGIILKELPIGTILAIGNCLLELTQIGKECHSDCAIKKTAGKCVMPTEGVFCRVLQGGTITPGDLIRIVEKENKNEMH